MAPLLRAYQFVVGATHLSQPSNEPRMAQCASDDLRDPMNDIAVAHEEWGIDVGGE
jgi:fumarylacetoacetate (FAA) hydrolase